MATGQDPRACNEDDPQCVTDEDLHTNLDAKVREWEAKTKQRPIKFVVAGRGGIGKSALVSNLLGIGGKVGYSAKAVTVTVEKLISTIRMVNNDVEVIAFDMPGLGDERHVNEVEVTDDLEKQTDGSIDVFLYCSSLLPNGRVSNEDDGICKLFTRTFGTSLWKKAIYVLTFVNCVDSFDEELTEKQYKELTSDYYERFKRCLKEIGIPEDIIKNIPCCAAGSKAQNLPIEKCDNWQDYLYLSIIDRADSSITPALVKYRWGSAVLGTIACAGGGGAMGVAVGVSVAGPLGAAVGGAIGAVSGGASSGYFHVGNRIQRLRIKKYLEKEDEKRKEKLDPKKDNEQAPMAYCLLS